MYECPLCRQRINTTNTHGGWQSVTRFNSAIAPPWEQSPPNNPQIGADYYRKQPARQANFISDVLVPLAQSAITGTIGGLISGVLLSMTGYSWQVSSKGGLIIGLGFLGLFWLILLNAHRSLLWIIEEITGTDIDGDGQAGKPQPQPQTKPIQLEVNHYKDNQHYQQQIIDLPQGVTEAMFLEFCKGVTMGKGLSISEWTGDGKLLSKNEHAEILSRLAMAGMVIWINENHHNLGRKLTAKGKATLKAYVDFMA